MGAAQTAAVIEPLQSKMIAPIGDTDEKGNLVCGGLRPVVSSDSDIRPTGQPGHVDGLATGLAEVGDAKTNSGNSSQSNTSGNDALSGMEKVVLSDTVGNRRIVGDFQADGSFGELKNENAKIETLAAGESDSGKVGDTTGRSGRTGDDLGSGEPIELQTAEIPEPLTVIPEPVRGLPEPDAIQIPEPALIDTEQRTYEIPEPVRGFAGTGAEIPEPAINNPEPLELQTAEIPELEAVEQETEINADEVFSKDYRLWNLETYKDRHGKHRAKRVLRFVSKPPKIEIGKITEEIAEELRSRRGKGRWKLSRDEAEEYRGNAELVAESIRRDKGQRDTSSDNRDFNGDQDYADGNSLLPETSDAVQWGELPTWRM